MFIKAQENLLTLIWQNKKYMSARADIKFLFEKNTSKNCNLFIIQHKINKSFPKVSTHYSITCFYFTNICCNFLFLMMFLISSGLHSLIYITIRIQSYLMCFYWLVLIIFYIHLIKLLLLLCSLADL